MMEYEIKNTVVLVTGAATGIGAGIVKAFLDEGAKHVAVLDVMEEAGLKLEIELNTKYGSNKVKFHKCDVTDEDQLFKAFDETLKTHDYIDVVINNAGIMNDDRKVYKKAIDINVTAVITGSLKALDVMRKDRGGKGGTIINISSIVGLSQSHFLPIYSATKSAVLQFSNCIGMETTYKETGVRVVTVCFGVTDTPLIKKTKVGFHDEKLMDSYISVMETIPAQKPESAVNGVVVAFKQGKSSSTWLAQKDKPPVDITQDVLAGYSAMGSQMRV